MYLFDSDVLIEAYRTFYSFSLCPGFWDFLDQEFATGEIRSIREVRLELEVRSDDLSTWAKARAGTFFLEPTSASVTAMQTVSTWAMAQAFTDAAKREFLGSADSFLVAYGLAYAHTVVTLETPNQPGQTKRIKIPSACVANSVSCERPFEVLQRRGARFVL